MEQTINTSGLSLLNAADALAHYLILFFFFFSKTRSENRLVKWYVMIRP